MLAEKKKRKNIWPKEWVFLYIRSTESVELLGWKKSCKGYKNAEKLVDPEVVEQGLERLQRMLISYDLITHFYNNHPAKNIQIQVE